MKNSDIQGFLWALDFIFIWNEVQVNLLVCLTSDCLEPGRRTDVGVEDTYFLLDCSSVMLICILQCSGFR